MSKKKVLVCSSKVPFIYGGAELLVEKLMEVIDKAGYQTDLMSVPFAWDPPDNIIKNCLAWRMLDPMDSPWDKPDLVITTKFPSYAIEYPNKVAWVIHQHRGAYDLTGTIYDDIGRYANAGEYRDLIRDMDKRFLSECKAVFTISNLVSKRMHEYCGINSEVIYHPPPLDGRYYNESYGKDILLVGRLEPLKRVDLAIKAMKYVKTRGAKLRVIGRGFLEESLHKIAADEGVNEMVSFEGFVSDEELLAMYANAGCIVFVPYQEDYGYATLEAFQSIHPMIVTHDCGGPLEFVEHGLNGYVVPAKPQELAEAIDELLGDKRTARQFGEAGFELTRDIRWDNVIKQLVTPFISKGEPS